jgi:hypothetical protein
MRDEIEDSEEDISDDVDDHCEDVPLFVLLPEEINIFSDDLLVVLLVVGTVMLRCCGWLEVIINGHLRVSWSTSRLNSCLFIVPTAF